MIINHYVMYESFFFGNHVYSDLLVTDNQFAYKLHGEGRNHEKLLVAKLVEEFPTLYIIQTSFTVFTCISHIISHINPVHKIIHVLLTCTLVLSFHLF
jgi:hypothetical protein